jgi:polyferredoxin
MKSRLSFKIPLWVQTAILCVLLTLAIVTAVVTWKLGNSLPFYVTLTAVMVAAAGINLMMVSRRLAKLRAQLSRAEHRVTYLLYALVTAAFGGVIGVAFTLDETLATYPMIFSTVPVYMLFLNGYIAYVESEVASRTHPLQPE